MAEKPTYEDREQRIQKLEQGESEHQRVSALPQDAHSLKSMAISMAQQFNVYNQQFGDTAVRTGVIDKEQLGRAQKHQKQIEETTKIPILLGRTLVQLGYISEKQRAAILAAQSLSEDETGCGGEKFLAEKVRILCRTLEIYNQRFSDIALNLGFISEEQLKKSLQMQRQVFRKTKIKAPIGRIMVQLGYITKEERTAVLAMQALSKEAELGAAEAKANASEPAPEAAKSESEAAETETEEPKAAPETTKTESGEDEVRPDPPYGPAGNEQKRPEDPEPEKEDPEDKIHGHFAVDISKDKLTARLVSKSRDREGLVLDDLLDLIEAEGIRHGIVEKTEIRRFYEDDSEDLEPLTIAQGFPPVKGKDQEVIFHFDIEYLRAGTVREDGTIDWKNRGEVPQVNEGDLLAKIIPGVYGKVGMDVFGNEIPVESIAEVGLAPGKGVKKSEDGNSFIAGDKGAPTLSENQTLTVLPVLQIPGDIGVETGHVEFDGHIEVEGSIQSGYLVKGASLRAQDMNGAEVYIDGDVVVTHGIFQSKIKCQGNVKAVYVHKSDIDARGDLVVGKEIADSKIELYGACQLDYGTIIASEIAARGGIIAQHVGTGMSKASHLDVGVNHKLRREISGIKKLLSKTKRKNEDITPRVKALRVESDQINDTLGDVAQKQDQLMVQSRQLQEKFAEQEGIGESVKAEHDKAVAALEVRRSKVDTLVEELMQKDGELEKTIGKLEEQETEIVKEQAELEERLEALRKRREDEKGKPVVKVSGDLFGDTKITGPRTKIIIEEDVKHVNIFETDKTDDGEVAKWHMKIGPLR
ncbi:MAG: DUF342 domain-containing protein [Desulfobacterales bacterium]|nr:DUF342 domain-containing protein [Desulfobacterales bacterium]